MKVRQLIDVLSEYDPEAEIRLMQQPRWAFEYSLGGVVARSEIDAHEADEDDDDDAAPGNPEPDVIYILEGAQLGYGRKAAWDAMESYR